MDTAPLSFQADMKSWPVDIAHPEVAWLSPSTWLCLKHLETTAAWPLMSVSTEVMPISVTDLWLIALVESIMMVRSLCSHT